jgi:hypothetical protein
MQLHVHFNHGGSCSVCQGMHSACRIRRSQGRRRASSTNPLVWSTDVLLQLCPAHQHMHATEGGFGRRSVRLSPLRFTPALCIVL